MTGTPRAGHAGVFTSILLIVCASPLVPQAAFLAAVQADMLKVGAILPLSGSNALHGDYARRGIGLALAEVGNSSSVQVYFEDSVSTPNGAVSAYKRLRAEHRIQAVLTLGSPMAMALAPLANQEKVVLFSIASVPAYSSANDFTYRIVGNARQEAEFLREVLADRLVIQKIAILYAADDYGEGVLRETAKVLRGTVKVIGTESFIPGVRDLRDQLLRIRKKTPELMLIAAWGQDTGLALKQAKELGMNMKFLCLQACQNPDLIAAAGDAAEELLIVAPTDRVQGSLSAEYQQRYREPLTFVTVRMYDAVRILKSIAAGCRERFNGECLREELEGLISFPGAAYPIDFDEYGDINEKYVLKTVRGGQVIEIP